MSRTRAEARLARLQLIKERKEAKVALKSQSAPERKETAPIEVQAVHTAPAVLEPETETVNVDAVILSENVAAEPEVPAEEPPEPGARLARVYAKPLNPRMRLVELDDGTHGKLWVRGDSPPMIGWRVWLKAADYPEGDWHLHGNYNWRGIRLT